MQVGNLICSLSYLTIETENSDFENSEKGDIFLIVDYCNRADYEPEKDFGYGYRIYDHQTGSYSWWRQELLVGNFKTL